MPATSGAPSFNGTVFHVWKANQPCRIYVTDRHVYFIRRFVGIAPGAAAVVGSQFGLLGGLAVGLAGAAKARTSADLVHDDDPTAPATCQPARHSSSRNASAAKDRAPTTGVRRWATRTASSQGGRHESEEREEE